MANRRVGDILSLSPISMGGHQHPRVQASSLQQRLYTENRDGNCNLCPSLKPSTKTLQPKIGMEIATSARLKPKNHGGPVSNLHLEAKFEIGIPA